MNNSSSIRFKLMNNIYMNSTQLIKLIYIYIDMHTDPSSQATQKHFRTSRVPHTLLLFIVQISHKISDDRNLDSKGRRWYQDLYALLKSFHLSRAPLSEC